MRKFCLYFAIFFIPTLLFGQEVRSVDFVSIDRYLGIWHEISRIPNPYQKHCYNNNTAHYKLEANGQLSLENSCDKENGQREIAKGVARIVDTKSNSKLEISFANLFGFWLFWGSYWIIGLDPDYQYTVIGTPDRKFGWVLSRKKALTQKQKSEILKLLQTQGYPVESFQPAL